MEPVSPISIKFNVEPGKATYIGNFNFLQTDSFGLTVTGVEVNYSDQSELDFKVLSSKYPKVKEQDILMGISPNFSLKKIGGSDKASWDIPIFTM